MALLNSRAHSLDHIIKFGTTISRESLSMGFLEKPQLLESDNSVTTSDFEIELRVMLATQSSTEGGTHHLLQLLKTKHVRLLEVRPAQKRSKVDQCSWEDPLLVFERRQVNVCVSLAQLLPGLVDEQRDMAESRGSPLERVIQGHMHGSRRHPFLSILAGAPCARA